MATTNDAMFTALSGSYPSAGQTLGDLLYAFWSEKGLQYRGTLERDWYISEGALLKTNRTNLIINPNFETNTSNWSLVGAGTAITRITTDDYIGTASLQVDVSGTVVSAGVRSTVTAGLRFPVTAGLPYMFSAYVKVPAGQSSLPLRIRTNEYRADGTQNAAQISSAKTVSSEDGWVRLSFADTPTDGETPTVSMVIGVELASAVDSARQFLVDAVLVEQSSSLLPYFDGTYADAYTDYTLTSQSWNGTVDGSSSNGEWIKNGQTLGDLAYNYFTNIYDLVTFDTSDPDEWLELQVFDRYDTVEQEVLSLIW